MPAAKATSKAEPEPEQPAAPTPENILSLVYRGALPEILRAIATQIDEGHASAENFTARVSREAFELQATIHLTPK